MIKIKVDGQKAQKLNTPIIAEGAVNFVFVQAEFSPEWDGLEKSYIFTNSDICIQVESNEKSVPVPSQVLVPGILTIGIKGIKLSRDMKTTQVMATHCALEYEVLSSGTACEAQNAKPDFPTVTEQLRYMIESGGILDLPLKKGEGMSSVQQKNGRVMNEEGKDVVDDSVALGKSSTALGVSNIAKGDASLVAGYKNKAYMQGSVAFGGGSIAGDPDKQEVFDAMIALAQSEADLYENYDTYKAQYDTLHPDSPAPDLATLQNYKNGFAFAAGEGNQALGRGSTVFGISNISYGQHNLVAGVDNKPSGNCQFVAGQHSVDDPSKLFIIGAGTSTDDRKNVFSVDKYGNIESPALDIFDPYVYVFDTRRKINTYVIANNATLSCEDNSLKITSNSSDPQIIRKFSAPLDGSVYKYVKIMCKVSQRCSMFFETSQHGYAENSETKFINQYAANWTAHIFDMSDNETWITEGVKSLRFDVPDTVPDSPAYIKYIGIFSSLEEAEKFGGRCVYETEIPQIVDNLDSTSSQDGLSANQGKLLKDEINGLISILSQPRIEDDNVIYHFDNRYKAESFIWRINHGSYSIENQRLRINTTGQDPYVVQSFDSQPLDSTKHKYIKIKYRIKRGERFEGGSKIHFATTSGGFSDVMSVDFSVVADGNWHTVVVDMSTNENWVSGVQYVRIDIPNHAYLNPTIWLDYVGYFTNQQQAQEY